MGWGICFALDDNYRLYCADGCRWRTTDQDYEDFVPWPSARQTVLDYYEYDAHSELDMIRDECPGTASALASACPEYLGSAFSSYRDLPDEKKQEMHEEMLAGLESDFEQTRAALVDAKEKLAVEERRFKDFKSQTCKTRVQQIEEDIRRLQLELPYQKAVENVKYLTRQRNRLAKFIRLEKQFNLNLDTYT